ncbi:MAG TPA: FAD-dependent oxidoreductase [Nitrospirae bacterium]|nr:dihydrolipoyl dehydrogenase [bacterium BMS3Abin10]GBE39020.1 dihydrolipoyl dehydrogenase [bacterium BMS3Bbin08]HDH11962.1 FAD-dependent oxidoreductase [Nitrospirota bacterium]HDK81257.1 FAD-dependent oxidoreductase [Nitrospirota bacterium]
MKHFDVVIIGGGPGGTPAAIYLAQAGKEVLLVDGRGKPGGECLFEGCIPSKILEQSADCYYLLKNIHKLGIKLNGDPSINWGKVIEKKNSILKLRSEAALNRLKNMPGLTFADAKACFASNNVLDKIRLQDRCKGADK